MDAIEAIKTRRSVRRYTSQPIPDEVLEDIIDCARLAPSARNQQPWAFVVITDPEVRGRIAQEAQKGRFIAGAPACVAVFCRIEASAPLQDACAAVENILLAAHAYGIGSCWVNSYHKGHSATVAALLGCPRDMELAALVALGYPEEIPSAPEKRPLNEVMYWQGF
jgi:nitroreductase